MSQIGTNKFISRKILVHMMEDYRYMTLNQFRALVKKTQFPKDSVTLEPNKAIKKDSVEYETQNILYNEESHNMRYLYNRNNQDVYASCILSRTELGLYPKPSKAITDSVWLHIALFDQIRGYSVNIEHHGIYYQSIIRISGKFWYTALINPDEERKTEEMLKFWKEEKKKEEGTHNNLIFYTLLDGTGRGEADNYQKAEKYDFQGTGDHVCLFGLSFNPQTYSIGLKGKLLS